MANFTTYSRMKTVKQKTAKIYESNTDPRRQNLRCRSLGSEIWATKGKQKTNRERSKPGASWVDFRKQNSSSTSQRLIRAFVDNNSRQSSSVNCCKSSSSTQSFESSSVSCALLVSFTATLQHG